MNNFFKNTYARSKILIIIAGNGDMVCFMHFGKEIFFLITIKVFFFIPVASLKRRDLLRNARFSVQKCALFSEMFEKQLSIYIKKKKKNEKFQKPLSGEILFL